VKLLFLENY